MSINALATTLLLPLDDHAKVSVTVEAIASWVDRTYGILHWTGTAEELDASLQEAEDDFLEGN